MWEPVGPLPASVYWRRRWVAVASTVTVVVALIWIAAAALAGPADGEAFRPQAHTLSAPQEASPPPAALAVIPMPGAAEPGTPPSMPPPPTFQLPATPAPGTASAAPSEQPSEQLLSDETPQPSTPIPPPVAAAPTEPVPCTNEMIGVGAEVERPEHRVGERAVLRLVVTNVGDRPCVRDLDAARQEVVVWSGDGAKRLWSSNDCSRAAGADLKTLLPGRPMVFTVRWAGRTSTPGCTEEREVVPAGSYRVLTRVDDVISDPAPFQRLP